MINPGYYLEYSDHWRCFDGDDGMVMRSFDNKDDAMAFVRGWNQAGWAENPQDLSLSAFRKWFPGTPNTKETYKEFIKMNKYPLAPLQPATCTAWTNQYYIDPCPPVYPTEEAYPYEVGVPKGNNPMYTTKTQATDLTINLAPAASANVTTKSDTAIQRDYLMNRHRDIEHDARIYGTIGQKLRSTFHMDVNNKPKSTQGLIDAIKNSAYTLDDRVMKLQAAGEMYDESTDDYIGGPFAGIIWNGPMPDKAGYDAAFDEFKALLKDAKDTIIVKSPDEGLAAIKALEAWTPVGKAS